MTVTRPRTTGLRLAMALFALLALAIAFATSELNHFSASKEDIRRRTQGNLEQSRTAIAAQGLVARQEAAIRDLVMANEPAPMRDAEDRMVALGRDYIRAQERLVTLFASDSRTSDVELSLLEVVKREQIATIDPLERATAAALRNEDELATTILIEQVLPHQSRLREALSDLDAAQRKQNHELEVLAEKEYSAAFVVTGVLGVMGTLCVGIAGWIGTRTFISRRVAPARTRSRAAT